MTEEHVPHDVGELKHDLEEHDEWFRHAPTEEHQAAHGDFNPIVVMSFLGITIAVVVVVAFLAVPWFARLVQAQKVAVREQSRQMVTESFEARTGWEADLTGEPTWIDERAGIVRIPIKLAMEEVVRRYQEEER